MRVIEHPESVYIYQMDGVNAGAVYVGGMTWLMKCESLVWREDDQFGSYLSLKEIHEQLGDRLITVVSEGPLSGVIYQFGNCPDGKWREIGRLDGYA